MEPTTANLRGRAPLDRTLPRFTLTVLSGPAMGTRIPLVQPKTIIGRSPSADLTIDDGHVSRYHVEIERLPGDRGLLVRDLRSKNGTYVRNCRIVEAFVEEHATVELGAGTRLEVSLPHAQVTGYTRQGTSPDLRPRAPASAVAGATRAPDAPRASAEEIPTGTLVLRREALRTSRARRGGGRAS